MYFSSSKVFMTNTSPVQLLLLIQYQIYIKLILTFVVYVYFLLVFETIRCFFDLMYLMPLFNRHNYQNWWAEFAPLLLFSDFLTNVLLVTIAGHQIHVDSQLNSLILSNHIHCLDHLWKRLSFGKQFIRRHSF